jgi:hypothetical protein
MVLISPSRRQHTPSAVSIAMINDDVVSVLTPTETIGFVHRVGRVYVAMQGSDLAHAVEVGQSLSRDKAVEIVQTA